MLSKAQKAFKGFWHIGHATAVKNTHFCQGNKRFTTVLLMGWVELLCLLVSISNPKVKYITA